jgi:hypothetical protein
MLSFYDPVSPTCDANINISTWLEPMFSQRGVSCGLLHSSNVTLQDTWNIIKNSFNLAVYFCPKDRYFQRLFPAPSIIIFTSSLRGMSPVFFSRQMTNYWKISLSFSGTAHSSADCQRTKRSRFNSGKQWSFYFYHNGQTGFSVRPTACPMGTKRG